MKRIACVGGCRRVWFLPSDSCRYVVIHGLAVGPLCDQCAKKAQRGETLSWIDREFRRAINVTRGKNNG